MLQIMSEMSKLDHLAIEIFAQRDSVRLCINGCQEARFFAGDYRCTRLLLHSIVIARTRVLAIMLISIENLLSLLVHDFTTRAKQGNLQV